MRRFATIAAICAAVLVLGSCSGAGGAAGGDEGQLGSSFTLSGQLYQKGAPWTSDGELCFAMSNPPEELFLATVTDGVFGIEIGDPDLADKHWWSAIVPEGATVSDPTATGCVINEIVYDIDDDLKDTVGIVRTNVGLTTTVYWAYTDKDVRVTYNGLYDGTNTMDLDASMKAGWSRLIMTRVTELETYVDTIRIGEEPAGMYWTDAPR